MLTLAAGDGLRVDATDGAIVGRFADLEVRLTCARWRESLPASDVLDRVALGLVQVAMAALVGTASVAVGGPDVASPPGDLFRGAP